jgi:hypothetical protein
MVSDHHEIHFGNQNNYQQLDLSWLLKKKFNQLFVQIFRNKNGIFKNLNINSLLIFILKFKFNTIFKLTNS